MLIDTHCHLDFPVFANRREGYISEAKLAGVEHIVVPSIRVENFAGVLAMRDLYACPIALGLHPWFKHNPDDLAVLEDYLIEYKVRIVGEIGLDGINLTSSLPQQEELFTAQLNLARKLDLPVLLHVRGAVDRVLKYLRQIPVSGGIAHAFNGSAVQAAEFIKLGFKLGFGGALSYSASSRIRHLAATLPDSALVLETDAPDMRPAWDRQSINCPANIARFAQIMGELRTQSPEYMARITSQNACEVLDLSFGDNF